MNPDCLFKFIVTYQIHQYLQRGIYHKNLIASDHPVNAKLVLAENGPIIMNTGERKVWLAKEFRRMVYRSMIRAAIRLLKLSDGVGTGKQVSTWTQAAA